MEFNKQFGKRLTEELKYCKINQKTIARMLNISESNISNWKKGINLPSVEMLYKLCMIIDTSADYLLGLEDETGSKVNQKINIGNNNQISGSFNNR